MSLKIKRLNWEELLDIYYTNMQMDFPKGEIKPVSLIKKLHDKGNNMSFGLYEEKELCGYAIFEKPDKGNAWLLDYLAISEAIRGKGYGSFFVKEFKKLLKDADAIMIEIERIDKASNLEEKRKREKRKSFYLKNGLLETGINTVADGQIEYEILCYPINKSVVGQDAKTAMENIYQTFFQKGEYCIE